MVIAIEIYLKIVRIRRIDWREVAGILHIHIVHQLEINGLVGYHKFLDVEHIAEACDLVRVRFSTASGSNGDRLTRFRFRFRVGTLLQSADLGHVSTGNLPGKCRKSVCCSSISSPRLTPGCNSCLKFRFLGNRKF